MAVVVQQSRKELRQTIGYKVGAMLTSTTTGSGSTSSFIASELPNADNFANGKHFVQTSGDNDGEVRIIDEFIGGTKTGRFRTAMSSSVASGVTFELHDEDMPPQRYHDTINQAIRTVTRRGAPFLTDTSVHTARNLRSYPVPTNMIGVQRVEYRALENRVDVFNCDAVWDEFVNANVTALLDLEDKREGSGSGKFKIGDPVAAGELIATQDVGILDLSGMTQCEWWAKSTVATAAGDLQLVLSPTANAATETELLDFPALTANEWTRIRVNLANPEDDTDIVSVGIKYTTDIGAGTLWIDNIETTEEDSETWIPLHRNWWRIDKDNRLLVLREEGAWTVGHSLLKIHGVKKPTELTSDADLCDIDPGFITNYAVAQLLRARGDRIASSRDASYVEADQLMTEALNWRRKQQLPNGIRWVED